MGFSWSFNNGLLIPLTFPITHFSFFITSIPRCTFPHPSSPIHILAIVSSISGLNIANAVFLIFSPHHPTYSLYYSFCQHFPYHFSFIPIWENYITSSLVIFSTSSFSSSLKGLMLYFSTTNPPLLASPIHTALQHTLKTDPLRPSCFVQQFLSYSSLTSHIQAACAGLPNATFLSLYLLVQVSLNNVTPHFLITSEQVRQAQSWSEPGKVSAQRHRTFNWTARSYVELPEQPVNLH